MNTQKRKPFPPMKQQSSPASKKPAIASPYINIISISGTLGKDVEVTETSGGKYIAKTSLCVWQPGENKPTMWFNITMWITDDMQEDDFLVLCKGQKIVVTGRLEMYTYQDKNFFGITVSQYELRK